MTVCPKCKGDGVELVEMTTDRTREIYGDSRLHTFAVPCSYCNGGFAQRVETAKGVANIPSAFYDSTLKNFDWNIYKDSDGRNVDMSKRQRVVESFIDQFATWEKRGIGLYIHSRMRGSGKTFLASCICNSLIEKYPMGTRFVSASELISISKSGKSSGDKYDRDPIKLLQECKLLVLDDVGQRAVGTDWTNDLLFQILDARMQRKRVTIVTSNIPIYGLQIDDRVIDRINKICFELPLPEFCVRAREARKEQSELFKELNLL